MLSRGWVAVFLLAFSAGAFADAIDFNLRDTSAQLQYKAALGGTNLGKSEFDFGGIYTSNNNLLGEAGILVKDDLGGNAPGVSVGVGLKALSARIKPISMNATALAMGGMVRYSPPAERRLGFVAQLYLSPNITTFGGADRYMETGARIEYELIPSAVVYLGYRNISFNVKNTNTSASFDEGVHIGVRMSF
ncbi:MAG: YfaZ family outer membrane protein [Gallionella sp.]